MRKYIFLLLILMPFIIKAQDILNVQSSLYCQYTEPTFSKQLFSTPNSKLVEDMVEEILMKTNKKDKKNFKLIAANVRSVVAIIDTIGLARERYILYSNRHFTEQTDETYRYAILAHEIAHHIYKHTLKTERRANEEAEADDYMGFALFFVGRARVLVEQLPNRFPSAFGEDKATRLATIMRGYNRAESSLKITPSAGFADDGSGNAAVGMPEFPFPPLLSSAQFPLDNFFSNCKTYDDVNKILRRSLEDNGYYEKSYFYIKKGYVLVTRMEQIKRDGYSFSESNRWKTKPVREENFSLTSYIKTLFTSEPGYFRVFAFVVTDEPFKNDKNRRVEPKDIEAWVNEGFSSLPDAISKFEYKKNVTQIRTMIYEFKIDSPGKDGVQSKPSELSGEEHLKKSKILLSLRK